MADCCKTFIKLSHLSLQKSLSSTSSSNFSKYMLKKARKKLDKFPGRDKIEDKLRGLKNFLNQVEDVCTD
jgi:hypothetical protein